MKMIPISRNNPESSSGRNVVVTAYFQSRMFLMLLLVAALLWFGNAIAGPGHDHGDEAPTTGGIALPRFAATSELFELVGVLNGTRLTLYLDHSDTNAPVKDAQLELEFAGTKLKVEPHGEGEFEATLPAAPKPGVIAIAAVVVAGQQTDLLAGELDLHDDKAETAASDAIDWRQVLPWAGGLIALVGLIVFLIRRKRQRSSFLNGRRGGAA
jgi:hypothetical protein